jgi:hypothetical protein
MMQDDDHGSGTVGEVGDQDCCPQWMLSGRRRHDHRKPRVQQRPLISWRPADDRAYMMINIEVIIIDPHRTSTAG